MPSRMNHVYSRRMPQSGKPPGPVRSNPSFSSRTYCWSFFQLSSRRASTFAMNASRSDCAFTASATEGTDVPRATEGADVPRATEGTDVPRATEGTDVPKATEGADDADGSAPNPRRPRQSRASNCLD